MTYLRGERRRVTPALLRRLDALHSAWVAETQVPGSAATEAFHAYQRELTDAGFALITDALSRAANSQEPS